MLSFSFAIAICYLLFAICYLLLDIEILESGDIKDAEQSQ